MINKKRIALLCTTIVFVMAGYGLFMPIIPYFIKELEVNASIASLLLSLYALGQFISSPIFGNYADHNGSKRTLIVGLVGYFSTLSLSLLFTNLYFMLSLRLITGIFAGACVSSIENYIGKMTTSDRKSQNYTMTSLSIGIGMTIGPLLGFAYLINTKLIVLFMAVIGFILVILNTKLLHQDLIDGDGEKLSLKALLNNLQIAGKDERNRYVLQSFFLYGLITAGLEAIGIVYVMKFVEITPLVIGIAIIYGILLGIYVLLISPKIINRYNKMSLSLVLIMVIIIGLTLIMLTFSTQIMILGAFVVIGAMTSLIICLTTLITEINQKSGLMLGARNSALSLGSIIGPVLLSATYDFNPNLTMVGLLFVAIIILVIGKNIRGTNE